MAFRVGFVYIIMTLLFTVYGQLVIKWRVLNYGNMPTSLTEILVFIGKLLFDPFILSGCVAAFMASLCWMAAMTKFDLSFAYPFISLSFVLVMIFSGLLFHEPITSYKIMGMLLIISGIIVSVQG